MARAVNRSPAAISMLLNGHRSTLPPWDDVARIVEYCHQRATTPPSGLTPDLAYWRHRHHEAETDASQAPPLPRAAKPPASPHAETIPDDFLSAVNVLIGERKGFDRLAAELLEPLKLYGAIITDLNAVLEGFAERVRASCATTRTALLRAADLVILVTAFCEALGTSGIYYTTELGHEQGDLTADVVAELERVTLGSQRVRHSADLRAEIAAAYAYAADTVCDESGVDGQRPDKLAHRAWRRYQALLAQATWECPELRLTSETEDPPEAINPPETVTPATSPSRGLAGLSRLLETFAQDDSAPAPAHQQQLRAPLAQVEESGPRIPDLEAGYINPAFRVAGRSGDRALARDDWWEAQPLWDDLEDFLAAHLLTEDATRAPLLILGHPGSGKSLLTKLIAARLPAAEFLCQRIELRHLPADLAIQEQLEEALLRSTGRRIPWPDVTAPDADLVRVVLLDGFDELLQAAADHMDPTRHFTYLQSIQQFQQREADHARPTIVIVTSRTVVADQALTPHLSTVIRLEPFDADRIRGWLHVWNTTNRRYFSAHALQPLTWDVVCRHEELAGQPLLLLMLALYDASDNALHHLHGEDIHRLNLYERLLTEFVRRQVTKHNALPSDTEAAAVAHELKRLSVIAIGMFNRHRQGITATDAEQDLAALLDAAASDATPLLFGRFFFIHEAQAIVIGHERRAYEFLHATFGEYLLTRLVTGELRDLLATTSLDGDRPVDDGRLYALLSHVPLTDRAEVVRNTSEQLTRLTQAEREHLTTLLTNLFNQASSDTHHRTHVPYRPAPTHRTQQDAVYSANLLLLAVMVHSTLRASTVVGTRNTADRWRRHTLLWRSQFSDGSWDAFTRTLTVKPFTDPATGHRDLHVGLATHRSEHELAWAVHLATRDDTTAETFHYRDGAAPATLYRPAVFTYDLGAQHVLHAVTPVLHWMPTALETYHGVDRTRSLSLAHALISLLYRPATDPWPPGTPYAELLLMLRSLSGDQRLLAADILGRHLLHAAADLPATTVIDILDQLTTTQFTSAGGLSARTWLVLAQCVNDLAGRPDIPHDQLSRITRRFGPDAPALDTGGDPRTRLLCLLTEAQTSTMWHATDQQPGQAALTEGITLLERIPHPRPAQAVVDLLRLARDLGADDWLAEHTEPLLKTLTRDGRQRLRPTDVDWLQTIVRDETLLAELNLVTRRWRQQ
ncbi:NACHT domain-containing NTPase [Streptomyces sp. Ag109_G2-15]|uniref:NACHT domain-containing protein n=1 Tax=Streptomyces sp. Ag109_G2-15 TaxID=1938850 RepID=UPI00117F105D|nr:ATP-binding protein [Streptomyces sp. Ag109_G2-15]